MPSEDVLQDLLRRKGLVEIVENTPLVQQLSGKPFYVEHLIAVVSSSMNQYAVNCQGKYCTVEALFLTIKSNRKTILEILLQDHPNDLQKALEKLSLQP
jgi:DNA/RNA endonuclease YhcR with UshA esterase domain